MAQDAIITVTSGAQSASFTVPNEASSRIIPMIEAVYRPLHPGNDPTLMQCFAAGFWHHLLIDTLRYERSAFTPDPLDVGDPPEIA